MADLDDAGGWPEAIDDFYAAKAERRAARLARNDEPPALDESAYFDECDLAELFEPSEADSRWHAEHAG